MADVIVRSGSDPALDDTDDKALEALLDSFDPSNPDAPLEAAVPEPPIEATPAEPEVPPAEPPPVEPEPEPTAEPEIDLAASAAEGARLELEAVKAQLALQQAHGSRLAGELGFLKKQLSTPRPSEPYEPQSEVEIDRLARVEQALEVERTARIEAQVSQAIGESVAGLDGAWSQELAAEIQQVVPKYADQIRMAKESRDPELARQITTGVILSVKAAAERMAWEVRHKGLVERKATTAPAALAAKKAAAGSGAGAVPAPPPKPTSVADMTAEEADKWLRENVRW